MDAPGIFPRGLDWGAPVAAIHQWLTGRNTHDPHPLTSDVAARLLEEPVAGDNTSMNMYSTGPLASYSPPTPLPAHEQVSPTLFTAFPFGPRYDTPSTSTALTPYANGTPDGSLLLDEQSAFSPAVSAPASNGMNMFSATGPLALFTPSTPFPTSAHEQVLTALRVAPQSDAPSTSTAFARHANGTPDDGFPVAAAPSRPHEPDHAPVMPPPSACDSLLAASQSIAHGPPAARHLEHQHTAERTTPRAHPYAGHHHSHSDKHMYNERQSTTSVEKARRVRREQFIGYRSQAAEGSMDVDIIPAGQVADDSDGDSAREDESPVTPAPAFDSTPAVHGSGHDDDDADPFADDDDMDVADDADRAKYSHVNLERTADDFYFPPSPASSSSSIHIAAHADEAPVTPAPANMSAPDSQGFEYFVMFDKMNDGATPAGDAELEHSTNATREPTASASLQSHTASAVAAPIPPPPFVLTVDPPSPRLDEVDEDELRQAHEALDKDGNIWLDCTSTSFIMAFVNSGEAITSLSLEYTDPREGGLGLTLRLVDNLARDMVFTNIETDVLYHLKNSSTILACTEVSIDLSLRSPHYPALATTTLPRVTLLRVKVSRNQDSGTLDDDLVVLHLPSLQTIMHCVPPPAVSDAQASAFVDRHVEHDGTALVFAM